MRRRPWRGTREDRLASLVYLVCLVWLVESDRPNEPDPPVTRASLDYLAGYEKLLGTVKIQWSACLDNRGASAECSKRPSSKAAGESKPEAYPLGYVEDFDEPRTKLADFLSILSEESALLEVIFVNDGSGFGGKLSPFLQQAFDVFPDQV